MYIFYYRMRDVDVADVSNAAERAYIVFPDYAVSGFFKRKIERNVYFLSGFRIDVSVLIYVEPFSRRFNGISVFKL